MTLSNEGFVRLHETDRKIEMANKMTIKSKGIGNIPARLSASDDETDVIFQNILYAPDLSQPLLSIASINDNGIDILFTRKRQVLLIDKSGKIIAEGYCQSNLYYIKACIDSTSENAIALKISSESMKTKEVQDIYHLWHL